MCTADLGTRVMLVYPDGPDLTGVIVDNFGCHDVRLTDDPAHTPPGYGTQRGTVTGILTAPSELTDLLNQTTQS